ncbi:hypothetical protein [Actinoplanes aureus]|uniref:Uncharacterized protein n=1 Tax=Actinoplanes aureus TaxID=2792083 RepID=A0A931C770_9ACTN|nr:hypothetical protein [Actinoplanes aureus]MBG0560733.1 hypothetical protein [Actinoplanes aureus]
MARDELVQLLTPPPDRGGGVTFRQGVIVSWNPATAENIVLVGGSPMVNLPILNTSEASILAAGDVVSILVSGATWGILGRFTIPGTPEAASALSSLRTASDTVTSQQGTSSTSFTDLATAGPEVPIAIGATGRALVTVSAEMQYEVLRGFGVNTSGAYMSFQVSGANTLAPSSFRALMGSIRYATGQSGGVFDTDLRGEVGGSRTVLLEGLTPGLTTFTAKYAAINSGTPLFAGRTITVQVI